MKKTFVNLEIAKQLKEKGFVEPCLACYDGSDMLSTYCESVFKPLNYNVGGGSKTSAPLYQEVLDWLREKHDIWMEVSPIQVTSGDTTGRRYTFGLINMTTDKGLVDETPLGFLTYYEALDNLIQEAIKLI